MKLILIAISSSNRGFNEVNQYEKMGFALLGFTLYFISFYECHKNIITSSYPIEEFLDKCKGDFHKLKLVAMLQKKKDGKVCEGSW